MTEAPGFVPGTVPTATREQLPRAAATPTAAPGAKGVPVHAISAKTKPAPSIDSQLSDRSGAYGMYASTR